MPARKRSFTSKAKATAEPVDVQPQASTGTDPHTWSIGKTLRLFQARLCPGGNPVDTYGAQGDGCGRCPSVDRCTVARFNPKAR
jgi:hypothetical protein